MCGLVECNDESEVLDSIKALHRQLTEIIFGALCDLSKYASCIDALCEREHYLQWCVTEAEFLNRMHKVHGRYKKLAFIRWMKSGFKNILTNRYYCLVFNF
jgi:hypothetical protein